MTTCVVKLSRAANKIEKDKIRKREKKDKKN